MCSSISLFTWVVEPSNFEIVVIAKYYVAKVQYVLVTCYLFVVNWYLFSFEKKRKHCELRNKFSVENLLTLELN